jgi:Na+/glutamate symporter
MIIISFIVICTLVFCGIWFSSRCNLFRYYVSPPLFGGLLGILILIALMAVTGFKWQPEPIVGRLFVTCFLFFIGMKMGSDYTYKHIIKLVKFTLFATGLLVCLELLSWFLLRKHMDLMSIVGTMSFAWNDEWLIFLQTNHPDISFIFYTSMLLVFIFTPVLLWFTSNRHILEQQPMASMGTSWKWNLTGFVLAALITVMAYMMKYLWLEHTLFLFDFVISMGIGVGFGLILRKRAQWSHPLFVSIANAGKWGLYGFIIFMLLTAIHEIWTHVNWMIIIFLLIKLFVLSGIMIVLTRRFVRNHKHLIWVSAAWAFTLSAPVTCMNAMRTVTDRHGEADDVVLVVPLVILWLINYPHYYMFIWLYGSN